MTKKVVIDGEELEGTFTLYRHMNEEDRSRVVGYLLKPKDPVKEVKKETEEEACVRIVNEVEDTEIQFDAFTYNVAIASARKAIQWQKEREKKDLIGEMNTVANKIANEKPLRTEKDGLMDEVF